MMLATFALALVLDEAAVTEALDKFKADLKGKDAAGRAAAIGELAKTQGVKIAARINTFLVSDTTEVRVAAAAGLGLQTEDAKHAIPYLIAAATANAKTPVVVAAIVAALGKHGGETAVAEINKHFGDELETAKTAIAAAGEIKSPSSFDGLIKELKACDEALKPRDRSQGGFGGGGLGRLDSNQQNPREMRERARELQPAIKAVLQAMAGITCEDGKDWESWWKDNKAKFKPAK